MGGAGRVPMRFYATHFKYITASIVEFDQVLTKAIFQFMNEYTARIELTPKEIIFNKPHPAILLRISDKLTRYVILAIIQEIKQTIIFRRMQLAEPSRQEAPKIRMQAHLLSVTRKLISLPFHIHSIQYVYS